MINSLQITCAYDTSYNFGSVKYCMDRGFFQIKIEKNQYIVIKKINIKKKNFRLTNSLQIFTRIIILFKKKYLQYVDDDHKFI